MWLASPGAPGTASSTRYWHDVSRLGPCAVSLGRGGDRERGAVSRGIEEPGQEGRPGAAGVVEAVSPAGGAQLVAAEQAEQAGEIEDGGGGQGFDLGLLDAARRNGRAELPPHRREAWPGQGFQDAARIGAAHVGYPNPARRPF
jgi:hypothetical protein